jgi:hypothetical protein
MHTLLHRLFGCRRCGKWRGEVRKEFSTPIGGV